VPIGDMFSEDGLRVHIENDANAAAVAEHLFGAAQQVRDFIVVFAGVGLGGGIYVNDQLYRGAGGYAGEIGHTPIKAEPAGLACHCGKSGCWETYANQESIVRRVQSRLASGCESKILSESATHGGGLTLATIQEAADAGDEVALESLAEAGTAMGSGFACLANVFNPQKIILGGPVSLVGAHLLPAIITSMNEQAMAEIAAQTEVGISAFGVDASLIGAAAVVVDDILSNPTQVAKEVMAEVEIETVVA
jgi:predicted NBD/HSP70 family sugar kinase